MRSVFLHRLIWIYLGGRFGINFSSFSVTGPLAKADTIGTDLAVTFAANLSNKAHTETWSVEYTLDFKPGIVWCDRTMLFGIVGAAFNRSTLEGTSAFVYGSQGIPTGGARIRVRDRKTSTGIRGGLGLEHMLTRCISLHLAYVYTYYGTLRASGRNNTQTEVAVTVDGHTVRFRSIVRRQVTSIGASYYF